jgi:uncharacterized OB-fold protein
MSAHPEGIVYTETVVYAPPEQYAADAPYQLAIIDVASGGRATVRILGKEQRDRAAIGDRVVFVEERDGVLFYRKQDASPNGSDLESARPLV